MSKTRRLVEAVAIPPRVVAPRNTLPDNKDTENALGLASSSSGVHQSTEENLPSSLRGVVSTLWQAVWKEVVVSVGKDRVPTLATEKEDSERTNNLSAASKMSDLATSLFGHVPTWWRFAVLLMGVALFVEGFGQGFRDTILSLFHSFSTYWMYIVNDDTGVIATILAFATFGGLYFFFYVLHRNLAPKTVAGNAHWQYRRNSFTSSSWKNPRQNFYHPRENQRSYYYHQQDKQQRRKKNKKQQQQFLQKSKPISTTTTTTRTTHYKPPQSTARLNHLVVPSSAASMSFHYPAGPQEEAAARFTSYTTTTTTTTTTTSTQDAAGGARSANNHTVLISTPATPVSSGNHLLSPLTEHSTLLLEPPAISRSSNAANSGHLNNTSRTHLLVPSPPTSNPHELIMKQTTSQLLMPSPSVSQSQAPDSKAPGFPMPCAATSPSLEAIFANPVNPPSSPPQTRGASESRPMLSNSWSRTLVDAVKTAHVATASNVLPKSPTSAHVYVSPSWSSQRTQTVVQEHSKPQEKSTFAKKQSATNSAVTSSSTEERFQPQAAIMSRADVPNRINKQQQDQPFIQEPSQRPHEVQQQQNQTQQPYRVNKSRGNPSKRTFGSGFVSGRSKYGFADDPNTVLLPDPTSQNSRWNALKPTASSSSAPRRYAAPRRSQTYQNPGSKKKSSKNSRENGFNTNSSSHSNSSRSSAYMLSSSIRAVMDDRDDSQRSASMTDWDEFLPDVEDLSEATLDSHLQADQNSAMGRSLSRKNWPTSLLPGDSDNTGSFFSQQDGSKRSSALSTKRNAVSSWQPAPPGPLSKAKMYGSSQTTITSNTEGSSASISNSARNSGGRSHGLGPILYAPPSRPDSYQAASRARGNSFAPTENGHDTEIEAELRALGGRMVEGILE